MTEMCISSWQVLPLGKGRSRVAIGNAFTTFGIWAITIIVRLFLSFVFYFVSWQMGGNMTHIALLGNSVIDNKAYVGRGPDVVRASAQARA